MGYSEEKAEDTALGVDGSCVEHSDDELIKIFTEHLSSYFGYSIPDEHKLILGASAYWINDSLGNGCFEWTDEFLHFMYYKLIHYPVEYLADLGEKAEKNVNKRLNDILSGIGYDDTNSDSGVITGPCYEEYYKNILLKNPEINNKDVYVYPEDAKASVKYLETGKYSKYLYKTKSFKDIFRNPVNEDDMKSEIRTVCEVIESYNDNKHLLSNKHTGYLLNNAPCYNYNNDDISLFVYCVENDCFDSTKHLYICLRDTFKFIEEAGIAYLPYSMEHALRKLYTYHAIRKMSGSRYDIKNNIKYKILEMI